MCGISAIIIHEPDPKYQEYANKMTDLVQHRGPDNKGIIELLRGKVFLGHRRLSIIDLTDEANQPMSYDEDTLWIVFNGEIYNYIELRNELELAGYHFKTRSDTEVILASYKQWGINCLNRFNGMFAFVVVDVQNKKIFAARDRLGVKPIYYTTMPGKFIAFASEIKQFTAIEGWKAKINNQRFFDYLAKGLIDHTEETMFKNVYQLRGGQYMLIDIEASNSSFLKIKKETWWSLDSIQNNENITLHDASSHLIHLLEDSVRLRLRSDVPVGSCLSGGLDSSTIVCLIARLLKGQNIDELQNTFSSCFNNKKYDEREYIEEVILHTNAKSHYIFPEPDSLFGNLDKITWHQDEPFGSTSIFAQWCVFSLAKQHNTKVMLDGQGADELLAGYHPFLWIWLAGFIRKLDFVSFYKELLSVRSKHRYSFLKLMVNSFHSVSPSILRRTGRSLAGIPDVPSWINRDILKKTGIEKTSTTDIAPDKSLKMMSKRYLLTTNLPHLLHYEDRNSMAHSIEARVPFLDYRIVEFVYSLPDNFKISDGETKFILRHAITNLVPNKIRVRQDKMGFVTPEELWIKDTHTEEFQKKLEESVGNIGLWINPKKVITLLNSTINSSMNFDWTLWRIINAGAWIKIFNIRLDNL